MKRKYEKKLKKLFTNNEGTRTIQTFYPLTTNKEFWQLINYVIFTAYGNFKYFRNIQEAKESLSPCGDER